MQMPLIGCCGWSQSKPRYIADFPVIELQSTFYEPPSLALAVKWRSLAPSPFQFCLKAWQLITHSPSSPTYRKLKSKLSPDEHESLGGFRPTEPVMLAWERTAEIACALEARAVLFQCPASFRAEPENVSNMRKFFSEIKRGTFELAWEPRGDWPPQLIEDLCQDLNLLYCVDPFDINPINKVAPYWRLHGKGAYSYRYTDADLDELLWIVRECAQTQSPRYIFFNNIWMKDDGLRFKQLISRSAQLSTT